MKIEKSGVPVICTLSDVEEGGVFSVPESCYSHQTFIKTRPVILNGGGTVTAVCLDNGAVMTFRESREVNPLHTAVLVI